MVKEAEEAAKDEVWGGYRFMALADNQATNGLKVIDLGAGHSSASETLCGRVVTALKSGALLNDSVGAGYIDRHWPPAFKDTGAWPLSSLRQSFLSGALTRLIDPDSVLRRRIPEFVETGEFGLASGDKGDGKYERVWYNGPVSPDEVAFESGVFLLTKAKAEQLTTAQESQTYTQTGPTQTSSQVSEPQPERQSPPTVHDEQPVAGQRATLTLKGTVPPEVWNRLGTRIIPKLRSGDDLSVGVEFSVSVDAGLAHGFQLELRQALADIGLQEQVSVEES